MTVLPTQVTFSVGNSAYIPENLVHSTETPGGYRTCTFSLSSKHSIELDDQLVIYDNVWGKFPFVGRISTIHKTGLCYDFTAVRSTRLRVHKSTTGPGNPSHPSGVYAGKIYHAGTPLLTALQDALQLCEDVFDGGMTTLSGLQFVADSINMGGYTPEQVWNYIASILGGLSTPLLWHIRGVSGLQVVVIDFLDTAARYRCRLSEDQIDETYDAEQIVTYAAVEWGNDQVYENSIVPTSVGRKLIHDKYVNASSNVTRLGDAQGLVGTYLNRFGRFRTSQSTLTLHCDGDVVKVVPPVGDSDNWPLWLIESGHGIELLDRPVNQAPYNEDLKYIVGTTYTWDSRELSLSCGDAIAGLEGEVNLIVDYNVNRLFFGPYNGPPGGSHPLSDADLFPQVGPELGGEVPPSTSYGVPAFKASLGTNDPNVPYGKQVDPKLIADEGLAANIVFDPSTAGFQAAIQVTPGTFSEYRLLLGNSTGLTNDTVIAELYKVIPPSQGGGTQFLCQVKSNGLKDTGQQTIAPPVTLGRNDFYMIKVITPGALTTWAALSLHAKKNFPALKS